MAKKAGPCDPCKSLISNSGTGRPGAHDALNLEWRRESFAIYHCATCDSTLTHNSRDGLGWRAEVRPVLNKK